MKISEFVIGRNVASATVQQYINRHKEDFEGLITKGKNKKEIILGDEAIKLLEKKYPLPKPIEVITKGMIPIEEHDELKSKYIEALEEGKRLLEERNQLKLEVKEHEKTYMLIAQKDKDIKRLEEEQEQKEAENIALREEIEKLKKRNLWERILNK